ncbi:hypothetical protein [Mycobacterium persicum]|uniref:Thioredoxin n=1 Tax=Mycobacterium persicum TaxID=1487726 RepID=A0A1X0LA71_9MYCO|nr:hypothetical protein [Mycobacterium persicum]KZS85305.1 hypothetical protein A4G31_13940 [Mycobacterium persicum]ORB44336.1 hypothetical protein BST40_19860 [Mycobacterium persicum]ORB90292.1 hypothetical protein B1T49_14860 [Mycobacterium persicum]ORB95710.1 hypothetical protein B1T44_15765 [Mycobacterium persicum]ORC02474.1 hypothetical protein B1T48_15585 [Mycobacterium persicum]
MTAVLTDERDLVEYYFNQPWSDGLPVVPPTPERVTAVLDVLGGPPEELVARIPPRWGSLTRELLAVNMVMAGCKPEYAPVVRAAVLALTDARFNLNGIQATTHVVSPLIVVNGPIARRIGMNSGGNVFGSGNRANATIGRAIRLVMLTVGGGIPGELDKSTLGHPGKYTFCIAENEAASPWAPYHVEHGYAPNDSTVLVIGAEAPHSVTNHISDDPQGILDSIASAMSTIAHNNAVLGGSCTVVIGVEHAHTIASFGWTRDDVRRYLWLNGTNDWDDVSYGNRYATSGARTYNRNLPKWYPRESGRRVPIVFTPDDIHLLVAGGSAGRFSAFLPGWSTATTPVLRAVEDDVVGSTASGRDLECSDGSCRL